MTDVLETDHTDSLPAPLQGCLYCHSEGTIQYAEPRKIFGFGAALPTLTCTHCGSIALFDPGDNENGSAWRIRYKKTNNGPQYYYVMVYFSNGDWIAAEDALDISRKGYFQKLRIEQVQQGDLSWLDPAPLDPPPSLMSPFETVYLTVGQVTLQQGDETLLDSGKLHVTNRRIHLLGERRDWTHRLSEIQTITHDKQSWRIYVGASRQYYQGDNTPDELDAQLFTTVVKALWKSEE